MSDAVEPSAPLGAEGTTIRAKFRPARAVLAKAAETPRPRARAERLARQLALAHWIERAIETGAVASYGDVARRLGLTQPRITQIVGLLALSPAVQEEILAGTGRVGIREAMRKARDPRWPS